MKSKTIIALLIAILANTFMGGAIAYAVGVPAIVGVVGIVSVFFIFNFE